jgi:hypothetical protein
MGGVGRWVRYAVSGTPDNASIGLWVDPAEQWNNDNGFSIELLLSTSEIIEIRWDGTNHIFDAWVDGVKVADGSEAPANEYFHVQFYAFIDNSGFIRTKIDGVLDINYSGDTLPAGATAQITHVYLTVNFSGNVYWDDFVLATGDYTGDIRVDYIAPTADTAQDDWTASAGDSFSCIDEVPRSTADYIYTQTNGHATELDLGAWTETNKTPVLVDAMGAAQQDAATGESLKVGVDSNGIDDTTEYALSTAWKYYHHYMAQDPDGPGAWDDAAIEALKYRVEAVI